MTMNVSTQLNTPTSELLAALATSAITFASDEEANAAGFYWNDGVDFAANSTVATFGFDAWAEQIKGVSHRGLILQYLDPFTKQPVGYSRVRYDSPSVDKKGKPVRYKGPLGARVHSFYPNCVDWVKTAPDVSTPIILVEGEKKAYSAAVNLGIPTIGLGGVNSFADNKHVTGLIDGLGAITLADRKVYICFDSDSESNSNVKAASYRLAEQLLAVKANPWFVTLPPTAAGEKQGLDDLLVNEGVDAVERALDAATQLAHYRDLVAFRQRAVHVTGPDEWVDPRTLKVYSDHSMLNVTRDVKTKVPTIIKGVLAYKPTHTFSAYREWSGRATAHAFCNEVGKPRFCEVDDFELKSKVKCFNLWSNTRPELSDDSVEMFLKFEERQFENNPELLTYWRDWVATIVQKDAKMHTAWVFFAYAKGSGKSTLARIVGNMFGPTGMLTLDANQFKSEQERLEQSTGRQIVVIDDLTSHHSRNDAAIMRFAITNPTMVVNPKGKKPYVATDSRNFIITTNESDAVHLETGERRYFYVHASETIVDDAEGRAALKFMDTREFAGALRNYYLTYKISEGFDEGTRPPMNKAREAAIADSLSDLDAFVADLKAGDLDLHDLSVFTAADLAGYFTVKTNSRNPLRAQTLLSKLRTVGIVPIVERFNYLLPNRSSRQKLTLLAFGDAAALQPKDICDLYVAEATAREELCATPSQLRILQDSAHPKY